MKKNMKSKNSNNEIYLTYSYEDFNKKKRMVVKYHDLLTLNEESKINDTIINFYMKY